RFDLRQDGRDPFLRHGRAASRVASELPWRLCAQHADSVGSDMGGQVEASRVEHRQGSLHRAGHRGLAEPVGPRASDPAHHVAPARIPSLAGTAGFVPMRFTLGVMATTLLLVTAVPTEARTKHSKQEAPRFDFAYETGWGDKLDTYDSTLTKDLVGLRDTTIHVVVSQA